MTVHRVACWNHCCNFGRRYADTHTHSSELTWVRSSDRQENNLGIQWNNGHRKEKRVLLTWAGCPSFLKGTHWVYSGCYETMVHNRSAKKSIISRDGKIQLTPVCLNVKTGKGPITLYSWQYKYKQMTTYFLLILDSTLLLLHISLEIQVNSNGARVLKFVFVSIFSNTQKICREPLRHIDLYVYNLKWLIVSLFLSHSLTTPMTSATSSPVSLYTPAPPFQSQISPPSPTFLPPSPSFSIPPLVSNPAESTGKVSCPLKMSPSALVVRYVRNRWCKSHMITHLQ